MTVSASIACVLVFQRPTATVSAWKHPVPKAQPSSSSAAEHSRAPIESQCPAATAKGITWHDVITGWAGTKLQPGRQSAVPSVTGFRSHLGVVGKLMSHPSGHSFVLRRFACSSVSELQTSHVGAEAGLLSQPAGHSPVLGSRPHFGVKPYV